MGRKGASTAHLHRGQQEGGGNRSFLTQEGLLLLGREVEDDLGGLKESHLHSYRSIKFFFLPISKDHVNPLIFA